MVDAGGQSLPAQAADLSFRTARPAGHGAGRHDRAAARRHDCCQGHLPDEAAAPEQILAWFIRRWQIEVTFEEARAHLGMTLYSIVTLTARQLLPQDSSMVRHAAWYAKDSPTFSDTNALVRRSLWSEGIYGGSGKQRDMVKIPRASFDRLTETVCYAA